MKEDRLVHKIKEKRRPKKIEANVNVFAVADTF